MVRQRKAGQANQSTGASATSATAAPNNSAKPRPTARKGTKTKDGAFSYIAYIRAFVGCVVLLVASYFGYRGYLETRVNTPLDGGRLVEKNGLASPDMYWGSYRPGSYFGLKTRDPHSLVFGLMWFFPRQMLGGGKGIRHWCEQNDNLEKYGWTRHDGKTFGVQEIYDGAFKITTSFVKTLSGPRGGEWTARVEVTNTTLVTEDISLLWYSALDEKTNGWIAPTQGEEMFDMEGQTLGLGKFAVRLKRGQGKIIRQSYLSTAAPGLQLLRESVLNSLKLVNRKDNVGSEKTLILMGDTLRASQGVKPEPNFVASQVIVRPPFTLDIVYQTVSEDENATDSKQEPDFVGDTYTKALQEKVREFDARFEDTFKLKAKGFSDSDIEFARGALSNMLGGIGYFYGASRVQSAVTKEPVPYWKASLFTAVPSRSFFPRGFLWDEGFHGLLIGLWDLDLELDILNHWFDLMNIEGWIPREQILGSEALAKVPEEFVTQHNSNANPPTFFLTLKMLLSRYKSRLHSKAYLKNVQKLYPRLHAWFSWYNNTQRGDVPGTYRWRGRDELTMKELNPKTLTSGLDDFPRASHPSSLERHVDLRCWIALAAEVMVELAELLDLESINRYLETHAYLTDETLLNQLHLSPSTNTFADFGLHTDHVSLKKVPHKPPNHREYDVLRQTLKQPEPRFVDSTFGYVNLFPFLMHILEPDSPTLLTILTKIRDPEVLWTPYGLRSLSKSSPLYLKRNTEHDPPYWRGQIWININYLALRALHHYKSQEGPFRKQATETYEELRQAVVRNVIREYERTGYVWEQYNDRTGQGSGCKPFTGWSSLVVLIMAEQY